MSVHRIPPQDEPFDPRLAALTHAGAAAALAEQGPQSLGEPDPRGSARIMGELANAVACGLVYVGDQIGAREEAVTLTPVQRGVPTISPAFVARLVKALERIRDHEEHMGSGPPDDEMREIAREALRVGYPTSAEGGGDYGGAGE